MRKDFYGFYHPVINNNLCIGCQLCIHVCPNNNPPKFNSGKSTYAAICKDRQVYESSTSGGIATVISQFAINNRGGVVYGASFNKDFDLHCQRIEDIKSLSMLQGSKYVQSFIGKTFKLIKKDLHLKKVVFIGTPCQVAGLTNYLPNHLKKNLLTVSFICGGCPSEQFMKQDLGELLQDAKSLQFRKKTTYGIWIKYENGSETYQKREENKYLRAFDNQLSLRMSCFHCPYGRTERIGDITVGDFWGLEQNNLKNAELKKAVREGKGTSVIICSTNKGEEFIRNIRKLLFIEERQIQEAMKINRRLTSPPPFSKRAAKFRKYYKDGQGDFQNSVEKALKPTIMRKAKEELKHIALTLNIYPYYGILKVYIKRIL